VYAPACDPGDLGVAYGTDPALEHPEKAKSPCPPKRSCHMVAFAFFEVGFIGGIIRISGYPNGKLLIKPSKKNIKTFLDGIRGNIKAALGMSAADLIHWLNPKLRGWSNYHRHVVSKRVFARVDNAIFTSLCRGAVWIYPVPLE
jgi:Group II intron, maturase-specific domain